MRSVLVVGSLNVDQRWQVDRHPAVGETVRGDRHRSAPGGKGLNQAVAARRMGAAVSLIGRVGDDADGRRLLDAVKKEGISTEWIECDPHRSTGSALVVLDRHGRNTVVVAPGANAGLTAAEVEIGAGDIVIAQLEVPSAVVLETFRRARRVGATTILNPSPVPSDRETLREADVIVVNEHELSALLGYTEVLTEIDDVLAGAAVLAGGDRAVVVTLGSAGVVSTGIHGGIGSPVSSSRSWTPSGPVTASSGPWRPPGPPGSAGPGRCIERIGRRRSRSPVPVRSTPCPGSPRSTGPNAPDRPMAELLAQRKRSSTASAPSPSSST